MNKNKKIQLICLLIFGSILLCIVLLIGFLVYQYKKNFPGERTDFASFEEYVEYGGGSSWVIDEGVPEGASDLRYYCDNMYVTKFSIYSFVLSDQEKYDTLMETIKEEVCNHNPKTHEPYWEKIGDETKTRVEYTDKELEEMAYVKEHYEEMNYEEVLSMSDHKYGFYFGYGAKADDFMDIEENPPSTIEGYEHRFELPRQDCFDYVIEGNLEDYTVLFFDEWDGSAYGVLVDEETRRFVTFGLYVW